MNQDTMTCVRGISHTFRARGESLQVLENVSFDVATGEVIAILGPSGCGKSTLLRCIAGLLEPSQGSVSIDGRTPLEAISAQRIGVAFQDPALLPWRTVRDNILLPSELGRASARVMSRDRVARLLELTGLSDFAEYRPHQLSGGMKQRVSLARALVREPSILLLDEPFGALDLLTRARLLEELWKIIRTTGTPTVLVSHSVEEALFLATRVLLLSSRPAIVREIIKPSWSSGRSLSLLDDPAFLKAVADCRQRLLLEEGVSVE